MTKSNLLLGARFTNLGHDLSENVWYVLSFLGIIIILFALAFFIEKLAKKKNESTEPFFTTKKTAMIGMFSAIAMVLMLFDFPLPFTPPFYKLDLSELPVLIGSFAFGPAAGVMIEFIKILLKLLIKGTSTAFVGELANFVVGCSLILPASVIYSFKKTKKGALISVIVGTISLTLFGSAFNAFYLLPAFAKLYGMKLESLLQMGAKVNSLCSGDSIFNFVMVCVAPINLIKGCLTSIVTIFIYKPLRKVIKA